MRWKKPLFVVLVIACQLLVFPYVFASFFVSLFIPKYLYVSLPVFLLSILPSIIFTLNILDKMKIKISLLIVFIYAVMLMVVASDFSPGVSGSVIDLYTREPVVGSTVCYRVSGWSLFSVAHGMETVIESGCALTDGIGRYHIRPVISLHPSVIASALSITAQSDENYSAAGTAFALNFVPSRLHIADVQLFVSPINYSYEDCLTVKNDSLKSDCMKINALQYAFETANDTICQHSDNVQVCTLFVNALYNYSLAEGEYGVCTIVGSGHNLDPYLYWEKNVSISEKTLYVLNDDVNIGYTCYIARTSKPLFVVQDPAITGFYVNRQVYAASGSGPVSGIGFIYGITDERIRTSRILPY